MSHLSLFQYEKVLNYHGFTLKKKKSLTSITLQDEPEKELEFVLNT